MRGGLAVREADRSALTLARPEPLQVFKRLFRLSASSTRGAVPARVRSLSDSASSGDQMFLDTIEQGIACQSQQTGSATLVTASEREGLAD